MYSERVEGHFRHSCLNEFDGVLFGQIDALTLPRIVFIFAYVSSAGCRMYSNAQQ